MTPKPSRRRVLTVLGLCTLVANLLASCTDDARSAHGPDSTAPAPNSAPRTTASPSPDDEVLVRIDTGVDGFTTIDTAFARIPTLVVTGTGLLIRPITPAVSPSPNGPLLLPEFEAVQLSATEVKELQALAEERGLFATPPNYDARPPQVADAGSTIVTLRRDGATFVHRALALDLAPDGGPAADPNRERLAEFVDAAIGFDPLASSTQYLPERYAIGTWDPDGSGNGEGHGSTVTSWPIEFGDPSPSEPVSSSCHEFDGALVRRLLGGVTQSTMFAVGDGPRTLVRLLVRPLLPGSEPCPAPAAA